MRGEIIILLKYQQGSDGVNIADGDSENINALKKYDHIINVFKAKLEYDLSTPDLRFNNRRQI